MGKSIINYIINNYSKYIKYLTIKNISIVLIIKVIFTLLIAYLFYLYHKHNNLKEGLNEDITPERLNFGPKQKYKECKSVGLIPIEMDCPKLLNNSSDLISFSSPSNTYKSLHATTSVPISLCPAPPPFTPPPPPPPPPPPTPPPPPPSSLVNAANYTTCHLWTDDFNGWCRSKHKQTTDNPSLSIPSQDIWGQQSKIGDNCITGQGKALCTKGWFSGIKLTPYSTKCKLNTTDWDGECRNMGGNKTSYTGTVPSQETWGQESLYTGKPGSLSGCITGQNRSVCAKGFSGGQKLVDNSTKCYLWTDGFNGHCQKDYGKDWILDTRTKPGPTDSHADYGKYKGGCITGQGRGVCVKKTDIKDNDTLVGTKCGAWNYISDSWCRNDFGNDINMSGKKQYDCLGGSGRATCTKYPVNYPKDGSKCGAWNYIANSWCTDDYGPLWKMIDKVQGSCNWGSGIAHCQKFKS